MNKQKSKPHTPIHSSPLFTRKNMLIKKKKINCCTKYKHKCKLGL